MLLEASGIWRKIGRNESPITPGWEGVFSEVTPFHNIEEMQEFCSVQLTYKKLDFESLFTEKMVEAAAHLDFESMIEESEKLIASLPVVIVEFGVFMHQVAVAAILSEHKAVKVIVKGNDVTLSQPRSFTPKEILRTIYEPPYDGETRMFRFTVGPDVWKLVEKTMFLKADSLTPKDGRMLLNGNREKIAELKGYLSLTM